MSQDKHTHPNLERPVRLRFFISVGVVLALIGYVFTLNRVLAASDWPTVARGATDETNTRVTMIQYLLRSRGYAVAVDGHYGRQTQLVVRRFQASHGMAANGVVNARIWRELIVTLKPGDRGDAIRAIQVTLREVSDVGLPINGRFDARTERAIRTFQRNNGLPINGMAGRETWLHLTENIYD